MTLNLRLRGWVGSPRGRGRLTSEVYGITCLDYSLALGRRAAGPHTNREPCSVAVDYGYDLRFSEQGRCVGGVLIKKRYHDIKQKINIALLIISRPSRRGGGRLGSQKVLEVLCVELPMYCTCEHSFSFYKSEWASDTSRLGYRRCEVGFNHSCVGDLRVTDSSQYA